MRLSLHGPQMLTRAQAQVAFFGLGTHWFLIVDFRDIELATDAFLDELFVIHDRPEPINARKPIEAAFQRVRALRQLRLMEGPES